MGVVTEFLLLKDGASGTLRKTETRARALNIRLGKSIALAGKFAVGLLALGAAAGKLSQHFADVVNDLNDMATRTGIAVEAIKGLKLAAEGSGQTIEKMEGALRGFNMKLLGAQRGTLESVEAFEKLGVALKDANGEYRRSEEVLGDTVRALQAIEDPG